MDIEGITAWIIGDRPEARNCLSREPSDFAQECLQLLENRSSVSIQLAAELAQKDFSIKSIAETYEKIYS
jgi:SOS response regulatory protein OraA/RecX